MSNFKKILLFALLPAIIAGLFSIAPKLYDIVMQPRAKLIYQTEYGPPLESNGDYKQIGSINVSNNGKVKLSNILLVVELSEGMFEGDTIKNSSALQVETSRSPKKIKYQIGSFLEGESFQISILTSSSENLSIPKIILRSDQVLGELLDEEKSSKKDNRIDLLGSILAAVSVFLMSILFYARVRLGKAPFPMLSDKQDILFFIASRLNFQPIVNDLKFKNYNLSYLKMSDVLLAYGIADENNKDQSIKALKCLLLISDIAKRSLDVIISNLKILEDEDFIEDEINLIRKKAASVDNQLAIRKIIGSYIENPAAFLTQDQD